MGVFNQSVNFAAIGAEMGKTALGWMNGTIQIIDPETQNSSWDEWTNEYTGGSGTVLWSGPARIQHLSAERLTVSGFEQTGIRGIRLQIPLTEDTGFIRKGLQIIVTNGGNDFELEQLQFVVTSAINSSYAWLRTIEAEVDVKSVANSTWATISGTVADEETAAVADATIRSFHHEDNLWIMDYETKTDVLGHYELPADVNVPVVIVATKSGFFTQYYDGANGFETATQITPENHETISSIDFSLVVD